MKHLLRLLLPALLLTACHTQRHTLQTLHSRHDTIIRTLHTIDTLHIIRADSVIIDRQHDTIRIDRWHTRHDRRITLQHDTIYICRTDTLRQQVSTGRTPRCSSLRRPLCALLALIAALFIALKMRK